MLSPKPVAESIQPGITRLPPLNVGRRFIRFTYKWLSRLILKFIVVVDAQKLENFPEVGPALVVSNHLGDLDGLLAIAYLPRYCEWFAKSELRSIPILGKLIDLYGVIWVHRGLPDRVALRAAFDGLTKDRLVGIAPEGRESLTGNLEEGTNGAAYIALKSGVPVVPVAFIGTRNQQVRMSLKQFQRRRIILRIGEQFQLDNYVNSKKLINEGTRVIMEHIANLLPDEYQGVYPITDGK